MIIFLWIKENKKTIGVMINVNDSSSDFYFGHFGEAEDIPQSCMLSSRFLRMRGGGCF